MMIKAWKKLILYECYKRRNNNYLFNLSCLKNIKIKILTSLSLKYILIMSYKQYLHPDTKICMD